MRLWILAAIALAAAGMALGQEKQSPEKKPAVLLAWEKTRFKSALIEAMKKQLEDAGIRVSLLTHSKKGLDAKAADYDAVFITNSGVHSKVRPWILQWIETQQDRKDRILLHTTQTRNWKVETSVDAVTSASSRDDAEALATEYVGRLKKMIGN